MEDAAVEEAEVSGAAEFAPALVAAHPLGHSFAVAVGPELRVFDLKAGCAVSLSDDSGGGSHSDAIRAISFSADGVLFTSAGDDKLVKVWKTDSWCCIRTITSEKRVSAVAISNDGLYVTFADKFGIVWLVTVGGDGGGQVSADNKPVSIFGHYCSIITSMKFSPDGRFICTADRDFKIRVTLFPKNPIKGAHEIQSFCLGHTDFVSCIALTGLSEGPSFLLSGGGDSTVRLWDYINGCLLDTCQVRDKVGGLLEPNETEDSNLAVADICLTNDGSLVAVAIQGLNGVMLLTCDLIAKKLSFLKGMSCGVCTASVKRILLLSLLHEEPYTAEEIEKITGQSLKSVFQISQTSLDVLMAAKNYKLFQREKCQGWRRDWHLFSGICTRKEQETDVITMEKSYIPTSLASSFLSGLLWTVMGASNMPNQAASQLLTRLRIIPCFQKDLLASSDQGPAILEDSEVPHGERLLLALQGSLDIAKQEEVLASVLAALKVSMHKMLTKKNYSEERREQRKRGRNDKKIKK